MKTGNVSTINQPRLHVVPMTLKRAGTWCRDLHRHHPEPPRGHKASVGIADARGAVRGVAIVGRPVSRELQKHGALEVTRCVTDGCPNACSALYRASWRLVLALGHRWMVTYTLASEPGTSLRAAGLVRVAETEGGEWDTPSRRRDPVQNAAPKVRWEIRA